MAPKTRTHSKESLGPAIERLMAETGVTYRALAEKTGLSAGYLNHIVHGNRRVPSTEVIGRIGNALGVKPDYFREVRVRIIIDKLEQTPALVDRLYKRLS